MKYRYDIEIASNLQISGGYLMTTEPMTEKQAIAQVEKIGRELLKNSETLHFVSYWLTREDDTEYEDMIHVSFSRPLTKIIVEATKHNEVIYKK